MLRRTLTRHTLKQRESITVVIWFLNHLRIQCCIFHIRETEYSRFVRLFKNISNRKKIEVEHCYLCFQRWQPKWVKGLMRDATRTLCARLNRRKIVINRFHGTNRQMITVGTVSSLTYAFHNCHGEQGFLYVASTKVHGTVEMEIMENRRDFTLFFPFGGCGYVQCLSETGSWCKLTWTSLLA